MHVDEKHVIVTGGGSGIGRALARRIAAEGARGVVVADVDAEGARETSEAINSAGGTAVAVACDVRDEAQVQALVATARRTFGAVDVLCSNAGVASSGGPEAPNHVWTRAWEVNFLGHLYGVRAVLPAMLERGEGYLVHTASAAGLLTNLGDAPYSVTKHAVVAFAEWLAVTYGDRGIGVSVLCPQGVNTPMLHGGAGHTGARQVLEVADIKEPEEVADAVITALDREEFLILPHPEVREYFRRKADDYERWLRGMRRLQAKLATDAAS